MGNILVVMGTSVPQHPGPYLLFQWNHVVSPVIPAGRGKSCKIGHGFFMAASPPAPSPPKHSPGQTSSRCIYIWKTQHRRTQPL